MAVTVSNVIQVVRDQINEETQKFFKNNVLFRLIHHAQTVLAREGWVIEDKDTSITTTASTRTYTLPSGTIAVKRCEYAGKKLFPITFDTWDDLTGANASTTTTATPSFFFVWGSLLYLQPIPDTSSQTITLYRVKMPTVISALTDTLSVPDEYEEAIQDFLLHRMCIKEKRYQEAQMHNQQWLQAVARARKDQRRKHVGAGYQTVRQMDQFTDWWIDQLYE